MTHRPQDWIHDVVYGGRLERYYVIAGNERLGPFTLAQLSTQLIVGHTLVWRPGLAGWVPAAQIPELELLLSEVPPPHPHTSSPASRPSSTPLHRREVAAPWILQLMWMYCVIWSPVVWLVGGLGSLYDMRADPDGLAGSCMLMLLALPSTLVLFVGGLGLQQRPPQRLAVVKAGLWLDVGLALIWIAMLTAASGHQDVGGEAGGITAVKATVDLLGFILEICFLVWLARNSQRLTDISAAGLPVSGLALASARDNPAAAPASVVGAVGTVPRDENSFEGCVGITLKILVVVVIVASREPSFRALLKRLIGMP